MSAPTFLMALLLPCLPANAEVCPADFASPVAVVQVDGGQTAGLTPSPIVREDQPALGSLSGPSPVVEPTSSPLEAEQNEIVVMSRRRIVPGDPLQEVNAKAFAVTQEVDKALVGPVALAYKEGIPEPLRNGFTNFVGNLHEPSAFLNFVLQHKIGKAFETLGRFAINSTIGIGGVFDIAKRRPFKLQRRSNGFANTLGFYGVKPGAFMYLPFIGPTTVRDMVGNVLDRLLLPLAVGKPFNRVAYTVPTGAVSVLDRRSRFDEQIQEVRATADPYTSAREFYLQRRQAEIDELHGR